MEGSSLTLAEAQILKSELKEKIETSLAEFYETTGLVVEKVELEHFFVGHKLQVQVTVEVKL